MYSSQLRHGSHGCFSHHVYSVEASVSVDHSVCSCGGGAPVCHLCGDLLHLLLCLQGKEEAKEVRKNKVGKVSS